MTPATAAGVPPIKKHQHMIDTDCHKIRNLEPERPFRGMQDAVERLLPFHVRTLRCRTLYGGTTSVATCSIAGIVQA